MAVLITKDHWRGRRALHILRRLGILFRDTNGNVFAIYGFSQQIPY